MLRHNRCGTVSLEFAIAAMPLFLLVLGVLEVGYDLFVQSVLTNAVDEAARSVQVGTTQGTNDEPSGTFVASAVCPGLGPLLDCGRLIVGVAPIPAGYTYYNAPTVITLQNAGSANGSVCTGQAGQLMLLEAWYAGPTFIGGLVPAFATFYNGALVHLSSASAGFVNETFAGGQTKGVGC
ncbi:MAG TPA: TadE/TadG family type IV pilus assembly protein [Acetobacteraceae bacterium]|nr:TadE/TadG family type IV pilus assembly protein [Acetobacteraceae bacterium]